MEMQSATEKRSGLLSLLHGYHAIEKAISPLDQIGVAQVACFSIFAATVELGETMASTDAIDISLQKITFGVTDTAHNAGSTPMLRTRQQGKQHCNCDVTGIACEVLLCHQRTRTQFSTPDKSTETPYVTLPKPATATVQGVLGPSLLQKLLWSARNLLSNEFVGHSCSVQL